MHPVRSYTDYTSARALLLPLPDGINLFLFIVGCLDRFVALFGPRCRANITPEDFAVIDDALAQIRRATEANALLPVPIAQRLLNDVNALPVEDLHYWSWQLIDSVVAALSYCVRPSGVHAIAAAEAVINGLDADATDTYEQYRLEEMFIFPELRQEWERQESALRHLSSMGGGA